jgi:hypothetical protein
MMLRHLWSRYPALAGCVVAGLAAALVVLAQRYHLEQSYRTVEITVDGDDWTTLARRTGTDRDALYAKLYEAGARSVTLYATSLRRLADAGRVTYMAGTDIINAARTGPVGGPFGDLLRAGRIRSGNTYVAGPPPVLELVRSGLAAQLLPHMGADRITLLEGSARVLEIQGRGPEIEDASLGLLPEDSAAIRAHALAVEARIRNFHEVVPGGLEAFFAGLRGVGARLTLIFDGNQVLGYEQLIPQVAEEMKSAGFTFGEIESFTARRRQRGEPELALAMVPHVLRVFSLTPEELTGLSPDEARPKYVLAARERNVRVLYVRPFLLTPAGVDEVQANLDYVGSIAQDLEGAGYRMGKAVPLPRVEIPVVLFGLAALGALAASAVAVGEVAGILASPVPSRVLYGGVGAGMAVTAVLLAVHRVTLWSQILALFAALAFPTLSLMWFLLDTRFRGEGRGRVSPTPDGPSGIRVLAGSVLRLWGLSAASALGGILGAALLSQSLFMLEIRQFLGVKLAHVVPVVLIGLVLVAADAPRGAFWSRLRAWARQPLLLEYGVAVIAVGLIAVFALGRTGNTGLPLLGTLELKSRVVLSHLVVARPRTKEYLIGHPCMVLAFALAAVGARRWVLPAAVIGAVGQVGLVNSFSHIHTPLVYIFLRTIYALIFGSVIGAGLVGVVLWSRRGRAGRARPPDPRPDAA